MPAPDSSALFSLILENQTTGVLWLDDSLHLRYLNPAAETLLQLEGRQDLGEPLSKFLSQAREFTALLERAHHTRETLTRRELGLTAGASPDQVIVTVDCTVTPVAESEGRTELLVELVPLDRHLRISREDALSERNRLNRALVRVLAHEIRNPLGGLRGAAQLLARQLQNPRQLEYTRVIIAEADRLAALVDSLFGPAQAPRCAPVNPHELLEHVIRLTEGVAGGSVRIVRDYDPSLPEVSVDRGQLIQALLNLAKNACEAVGDRGTLTFRSRALRQFTLNGVRQRLVACLMIADDGPGIAPELQARLFAPLASAKPGGQGLGLALAQELVTRHGGLIECASRPGDTVFSVLLPIERQHEHA